MNSAIRFITSFLSPFNRHNVIVDRPVVLPNHLSRAIDDANQRLGELIEALAKDHPQFDEEMFVGIVAGRAMYLTAYAFGTKQAIRIAANSVADFEADRDEGNL